MAVLVGGQRVTASSLSTFPMQLLNSITLTLPDPFVELAVPTTYQRLMVNWRARADTAAASDTLDLAFNDDFGVNYIYQQSEANNATLTGSNSGAATVVIHVGTIPAGTATANYFGSGSFIVDGANDTTNFKTVQGYACGFAASNNMFCGDYSGQWLSTAAVNIVCFTPNTGVNIVAGSSFSVYGMS